MQATRTDLMFNARRASWERFIWTQWVHPEAEPLTESSVSSCIWLA